MEAMFSKVRCLTRAIAVALVLSGLALVNSAGAQASVSTLRVCWSGVNIWSRTDWWGTYLGPNNHIRVRVDTLVIDDEGTHAIDWRIRMYSGNNVLEHQYGPNVDGDGTVVRSPWAAGKSLYLKPQGAGPTTVRVVYSHGVDNDGVSNCQVTHYFTA